MVEIPPPLPPSLQYHIQPGQTVDIRLKTTHSLLQCQNIGVCVCALACVSERDREEKHLREQIT